eukprot:m.156171 g.156171  ORF g.156171 m.156171 type:complete len:54 (-) comp16290_c0_seq9:1-162(-)
MTIDLDMFDPHHMSEVSLVYSGKVLTNWNDTSMFHASKHSYSRKYLPKLASRS